MVETSKSKKIAIIAGGGSLPQSLITELNTKKVPYIILAVANNVDQDFLASNRHYEIIPGKVKSVLDILSREEVTSVVFAGHVNRPGILSIKVDSEGAKLLARITKAKIKGDNTILSIISAFLEEKGYEVISPNEILPTLLTPTGQLGAVACDDIDHADIELGKSILASLSRYDIGQAVIVENSTILGIEGAEGTDNLIKRCGKLKKESIRKGILIKMKKTTQDNRLDLPTIGVKTVENVYNANLKGIAIESGNSIIVNLAEVIKAADKYGIFILGVK